VVLMFSQAVWLIFGNCIIWFDFGGYLRVKVFGCIAVMLRLFLSV